MESLEGVFDILDKIMKRIKTFNKSSYMLVIWDVTTLSLGLLQACYQANTKKELAKIYASKAKIINSFLHFAYFLMSKLR